MSTPLIMAPNGNGQQPQVPVIALLNPPIPSLDPFLAILYTQFLQRKVWLEFFSFSAIWNTLAGSASGALPTTPMNLDPSIDFLAMQMNLTAYSAAGTIVANPDYLLEVQETSGRSTWFDGPVHVMNITGQNRDSGAQTYNFPVSRYIRGNNVVQMKLTNNTATAARVDLSLMGYRVTYNNADRSQLFPVPF